MASAPEFRSGEADVTVPTDDVSEQTADATEPTDAVLETTDDVTQTTDAVTEPTDVVTEATHDAIEPTDIPTIDIPRMPPALTMPPGWERYKGWAAESPHLPSWWEEGRRPEEDRDELLLRADINFFFGAALDGLDQEERDLKKDLFFRAERNFFFAQGLDERDAARGSVCVLSECVLSAPEEPVDASQQQHHEPKEERPSPSAVQERDHKRKIAATALSYEEKFVPATPRPLQRKTPKPENSSSGDGAAQNHWWENNSSTAPRPYT
jgi:hypothetical protein